MSHVPLGAWDMFNISSLLKCQQRSSWASLTILKRGTEECLVHNLMTRFIFPKSSIAKSINRLENCLQIKESLKYTS